MLLRKFLRGFFLVGGQWGTLWVEVNESGFGEVLGNRFFPHPIVNAEAGNLIPGFHST